MVYDLIIIGMGPAGITAAIYAKRAGLSVLMLESKMPGGLLNYIDVIDNYPGEPYIKGPELAFKMFEQVRKLQIEYKMKSVTNVEVKEDIKIVYSNEEKFLARKLIIATGRKAKHLGLKDEENLEGKGISHCAICDGSLYKDCSVAVVGGGNSAIGESIYLSNICKKVYLIHRKDTFRADISLVDNLSKKGNIEIITKSNVVELKSTKGLLSSIVLDNGTELEVSALFPYIGYEPGTSFIKELNISDDEGYILVNENYETQVHGIFAVGDIIKKDIYQIVTSLGEGAVAAITASREIDSE